jgi:hypothetical protein
VASFLDEVEKTEGKPFDINRLIKASIYNIVSSLLFGERFAHNDAIFTQIVDIIEEDMGIFSKQVILNFVEWLKFIPGDRFKIRRRRFLLDELFKIIQQSLEKHKESLDNPQNQDFIFSFLNEQKRRKLNNEDMTGFGGKICVLLYYFILSKDEETT